jgi:hypothetical protein
MVSFSAQLFYLWAEPPGTQGTGGWMGCGTALDALKNRKLLPLLTVEAEFLWLVIL